MSTKHKKNIVILYASVGGGHYSVAKAIEEAFIAHYRDQVSCRLVDILDDEYSPASLSKIPDLYPKISKLPEVYNFMYRLTDGQMRNRLITRLNWLYAKDNIAEFVESLSDESIDLVVTTFAFIGGLFINYFEKTDQAVPLVTIVTDWGKVHSSWYDSRMQYCFVPTKQVYDNAIEQGMNSKQVEVVGYPTSPLFQPASDTEKKDLRTNLDWPQDAFVALLMGGARGMGEMFEVARKVARTTPDVFLVVGCGKNEVLRQKLGKILDPSQVHRFLKQSELAQMYQAADVLVTKSGGATVAEAINSQIPIVTYDYTLEQERANTDYIVDIGVGVKSDSTGDIANIIEDLRANPEKLATMRRNISNLSHPDTADIVVKKLAKLIEL